MYRHSILGLIAAVSVVVVLALPLYMKFSVHPAYEEFLLNNVEQEMKLLAKQMVKDHPFLEKFSPTTPLPKEFINNVEYIRDTVGLAKIKIFSNDGIIVYSTDLDDVGDRTSQIFFAKMLVDGLPRTEIKVFTGTELTSDIHMIETYVPIYQQGIAVGVIEIYHNISGLKRTFHRMIQDERRVLLPVLILLLGASLVSSWLAYKSMVELKKNRDQYQQLSVTDTLTGLLNRRGFTALVEKQLSFLRRCGKGAFLLYMDVDDFKLINDKYGHKAGDHALIESAGILKTTLRFSDIIGRVGGDEFAALALNTDDATNEGQIKQRLFERLADWNRQSRVGYTLCLSIGVIEYNPDSGSTIEELMSRADEKMYAEKQLKKADRPASP